MDADMVDHIDYIRSAYDALNSGDADRFIRNFAENVVRTEFEDLPNGGTYRGIADVREHVVSGRSTWAEGRCHPERFTVVGDSVVVHVHVRVRLKDNSEWIDGHVGDVFTFRDGRIIQFNSYTSEQQALDQAGQNQER